MDGIDGETLVQILIFVAIFGAAVVQFIFRNLVKPLREAERRRREAGGVGPEKTLRDFLAELRGEVAGEPEADTETSRAEDARRVEAERDAAGRVESRRVEAERDEAGREEARHEKAWRDQEARPQPDLVWDVVEDAPPPLPPRPVAQPVPRHVVLAGDAEEAGERHAARKRRRAVAAGGREGAVREVAVGVPVSAVERSGGERRATAHVARTFARSLGAMASSSEEAVVSGPRALVPLAGGLRQAILAQVILGPPRAFLRRGGSGLTGGRHGGRVRP